MIIIREEYASMNIRKVSKYHKKRAPMYRDKMTIMDNKEYALDI